MDNFAKVLPWDNFNPLHNFHNDLETLYLKLVAYTVAAMIGEIFHRCTIAYLSHLTFDYHMELLCDKEV